MEKLKHLVSRNIGGKKVLVLFILTNIIYAVMVTVTIPLVMRFSGGMKLLDMMPGGYSPEYVNSLLNALGNEGRHAYLFQQIPLDMVYPLLFGISYCLVLGYFLNKTGRLKTPYLYLCLLPPIAGLFDYGENFGIIAMVNSYPENPVVLSEITNVFTLFKSIFTTAFFIVLIIFVIAFVISKLLPKLKTK